MERFETGLIEPRDFVAQMSQILELQAGYDEFCKIWSCIFTDELIPESMLEGLHKSYRLVLVSNTNALHFAMLRESYKHMLRHFDELVLSHEVRAMKPRSEFYEAAIAKAGCRPEECFYADDIPQFVAAARQMGIDGVVFEGRPQLEEDMLRRGIRWE